MPTQVRILAPPSSSGWRDSVRGLPDLDGRVLAIAVAGCGLGPIVAQRLADGGATLALADRTQEHADAVKEQLGLADDRVDARAVDLTDQKAADDWAASVGDRFGR